MSAESDMRLAGRQTPFSFFIDLDFDAVVEPIPACVTAENPSRYPSYTCGEHKYRRFVDSYAHLADGTAA